MFTIYFYSLLVCIIVLVITFLIFNHGGHLNQESDEEQQIEFLRKYEEAKMKRLEKLEEKKYRRLVRMGIIKE
jgi:hypothetical protein